MTATSNDWEQAIAVLDNLLEMKPNWDSYGASQPNGVAVENAKTFLNLAAKTTLPKPRVHASVIGAIGITFRGGENNKRKVYIEFYNEGFVGVLFSDGQTEPQVETTNPSEACLLAIIQMAVDYLSC